VIRAVFISGGIALQCREVKGPIRGLVSERFYLGICVGKFS